MALALILLASCGSDSKTASVTRSTGDGGSTESHAPTSTTFPPTTTMLQPTLTSTGPGQYTLRAQSADGLVFKVITHESVEGGSISVVPESGPELLHYENTALRELHLHGATSGEPSFDAAGNVFIDFNPGRYNGVIVLRVTKSGVDDLGTLPPPPDGYNTTFYGGQAEDLDGDGVDEVVVDFNNCLPSCADGLTTTTTYRWNGSAFTAVPEPSLPCDPATFERLLNEEDQTPIDPGSLEIHVCEPPWAVTTATLDSGDRSKFGVFLVRSGEWTSINRIHICGDPAVPADVQAEPCNAG